jgi:SAM-dependent methyltransferase
VATRFKQAIPSCRLWATDIDPEAIAWARQHLREVAEFDTNPAAPPLRYDAGSFDLVYAISVFTHLDEASQAAWLDELARVLAPGGLLIATLHGSGARSSCTLAELRRLEGSGFLYRVDRRGRFKLDGLPDSYQTTFHTRGYVEERWQRGLQLLEYAEADVAGHQDLVVLRRPSAGA